MAKRKAAKKAPVTNPSPPATNPTSGYDKTEDTLGTIKRGGSYSAKPPKLSA